MSCVPELADAQLAADVQGSAAVALRRDLTELREQIARLREEVTFYKSLMAPGSVSQGLQLSELEIRPAPGVRSYDSSCC